MKKPTQVEISGFNAERVAGLILTILREDDANKNSVMGNMGSLQSILSFKIAPIWNGTNADNGFIYQNGSVAGYAGDRVPPELQVLANQASKLLKDENLIQEDPSQDSPDWILITDLGRTIYISETFELDLKRSPEYIIERYGQSVFQIETFKNNDMACGSCFITDNWRIVTCKHVIENRTFKIHIDKNTIINESDFNVFLHKYRDLALLHFRSERLMRVVGDCRPISICKTAQNLQPGEQIITMGFPKIPMRNSQLIPEVRIFNNYAQDYAGEKNYLTFTSRATGGCSGGPAITLKGWLVGIMEEETFETNDSTNSTSGSNIFAHATPVNYLQELIECND
jgi:S1-C subfamily serine protease